MAEFSKVATTADIAANTGKIVQVKRKAVALFRASGKYYAMDNSCAHRGGPLGEGMVRGKTVMCPWHGWEFDMTSGTCPHNPLFKVACYEVKLEGEDIWVAV